MKTGDNWSFRDDRLKCYKVLPYRAVLLMTSVYGVLVQRDWIQSGCGVQWLTRHMDLILIIPFCSRHRISRTGHCVLSARSPSGPTMSFGIVGVNLFLFVQSILDFGYCRTLDYYFSLITRYLVLRTFADNSTWLIRPCRMQNDPAKNKE